MSDSLVGADAELWMDRAARRYAPGDRLTVHYRLADWGKLGVTDVEVSVLWRTSGLGEEDFGVHSFDRQRVEPAQLAEGDPTFEIATTLPPSPLSYDGQILRVFWVARLRGFFPKGKQRLVEEAFQILPEVVEPVSPETAAVTA